MVNPGSSACKANTLALCYGFSPYNDYFLIIFLFILFDHFICFNFLCLLGDAIYSSSHVIFVSHSFQEEVFGMGNVALLECTALVIYMSFHLHIMKSKTLMHIFEARCRRFLKKPLRVCKHFYVNRRLIFWSTFECLLNFLAFMSFPLLGTREKVKWHSQVERTIMDWHLRLILPGPIITHESYLCS